MYDDWRREVAKARASAPHRVGRVRWPRRRSSSWPWAWEFGRPGLSRRRKPPEFVSSAWRTQRCRVGRRFAWGDEVKTGTDARVALRAPSGHSLRLDTDTTLRVRSDREFSLERGALYVDSRGERADSVTALRIDTRSARSKTTAAVAPCGSPKIRFRSKSGKGR